MLFLCFVIVQFRCFFGGEPIVRLTTGMTYAEYARRGFFELVCVATLVLPLLIFMHGLLLKENPVHERVFRVLAVAQVLLLFIIMTSAVQRMRLYQSTYGLTELRFYATAFMGWLAVVFLWFCVTVLNGWKKRFAFGTIIAGLVMIFALHALNPDALIVRTNAQLAETKGTFDADYVLSLSADAIPGLIETLPLMGADAHHMASSILAWERQRQNEDWRSWSWGRAQASRVIRRDEANLREIMKQ